jgi:CRP-like cAMP-binding protein
LIPEHVSVGEMLFQAGQEPSRVYLLGDARVELATRHSLDGMSQAVPLKPFGAGAVVGDIDAVLDGFASSMSAQVVSAGSVYAVEREDLGRFFEDNPGVLLSFLGTRFVE